MKDWKHMEFFRNCQPKQLYFHSFQTYENFIYTNVIYLSVNLKSIRDIKDFRYNVDIVASLEFNYDNTHDEAIVSSVFVIEEYRGRGYAYYLFLKMALYLHQIGIKTITLDDDSENYRKPNNLYTLLGFKYVYEEGPEMFANITILLRIENFEYFFKHWSDIYIC